MIMSEKGIGITKSCIPEIGKFSPRLIFATGLVGNIAICTVCLIFATWAIDQNFLRAKISLSTVILMCAGTPPRIDKSTINFDPLWEQLGDDPPTPFSFVNEVKGLQVESALTVAPADRLSLLSAIQVEQESCYLTHTNTSTHQIILDKMYLNRHVQEEVTGPRCAD